MFWDAFQWLMTLLEVVAVIVTILGVGLLSALLVLRVLAKLAGPPPELGPNSDEIAGGVAKNVNPIPAEDVSATPK
jgi:hypothetical protein